MNNTATVLIVGAVIMVVGIAIGWHLALSNLIITN